MLDKIQAVEEQPSATSFNCFAAPVSEMELREKINDCVPRSTRYEVKWAVSLFESRREQRNMRVCKVHEGSVGGRSSSLDVIENPLVMMADDELNRRLAYFICEIRKTDGSKYQRNTLYGIIVAIRHFLKGKGKLVRLYYAYGDKFEYLRNCLDDVIKESASADVGLTKRQSEVITLKEKKRALGERSLEFASSTIT